LVFTHDPKFDEPALIGALRSGAGYVGALGSRRTQSERLERLREAGLGEPELAALHAPCGLDLGARTPEETAISVLAEIVASRTGRSAASLSHTHGPIHTGAEPAEPNEQETS
jgi:xanthine dehydrogenase accessory factor